MRLRFLYSGDDLNMAGEAQLEPGAMLTMDATCELQRLYESGIRFTLQPDAGCGFLVGYGDYLHRAENTAVLPTFERAVRWLMEQVHTPVLDSAIVQVKQPALAALRRRLF